MYPPWALPAERFIELCSRCDDCINRCPQRVLKKNTQGHALAGYTRAGCSLCAKCAEVCKTGSLSLMAFIGAEAWQVKAVVTEFCVNSQGTLRQIYANGCAQDVIRFVVQAGNIGAAVVDPELCNGCAECYRSGPKQLIDMKPVNLVE